MRYVKVKDEALEMYIYMSCYFILKTAELDKLRKSCINEKDKTPPPPTPISR